jgi:Spy/CpxP family protein refolding chaperone
VKAGDWRGLALTLVLTILIAAGAGFVGAKLGRGPTAQRPFAISGSVRQSVDGLLERDFHLTPDQKRQIQAIDEQFTRKHNLIWADIRTSNAELAGAVANDMTLNQQAKNAIMEIQDSVGRLHTESILYVLEVRKVLTPEQRNTFDEHVIMALMRDPA